MYACVRFSPFNLPYQQMLPFFKKSFFSLLLLIVSVFVFSSCASYDHRLDSPSIHYLGLNGSLTSQARGELADRVSYWDGNDVSGAPSMVIDLSDQRLYYYKGGKLVGVSAISTGKAGRETKTGSFKINQKDKNHVSSECGDYVDSQGLIVVRNVVTSEDRKPPGTHFVGAPMPYYMKIYPGVGMHAGFLPGVADSHGCIRLPHCMAELFFKVTPLGTPVIVRK